MAEKFLLKDHLFNAQTIGQLAAEYAAGLPGFESELFLTQCLQGFPERELLARLDWIADCLEPQLPNTFPEMAEALEAMMPPPLDPGLQDDDFGHFIHAVPGILAVRHGLSVAQRERALDLIYRATQRFSMEFYIRPFLNTWPDQTLARLGRWAQDENYHVRRLVSEGTRPKLPWAQAVTLSQEQTLPLLAQLHADPTRYVTRSVANHLNDISKTNPEQVVNALQDWADQGRQNPAELGWMTRHALRTLVKTGDAGALRLLGFDPEADVSVDLKVQGPARIGDALNFAVHLKADQDQKLVVDYILHFLRPGGKVSRKVHKLKQVVVGPQGLVLEKRHKLKADASTFQLVPGAHRLEVQVNGRVRATTEVPFLPVS